MDLDDFDRRLLVASQRDNRQTGEQLAYEGFTRRQLGDPQVKRFDTMVVMNRVKFETATPLKD